MSKGVGRSKTMLGSLLLFSGGTALAGPLNGPNFWNGITGSPFTCYRDVIIKNLTSGQATTCGSLVAYHARSQTQHSPCYQYVTTVAPQFALEVAHQGLGSLSDAQRQEGVIKACRPCCGDAYPWAPKTDM